MSQHMFTFNGLDTTVGSPGLIHANVLPGDVLLSAMVFANSNPANGLIVGEEVGIANFDVSGPNIIDYIVQVAGLNLSGATILLVLQRN